MKLWLASHHPHYYNIVYTFLDKCSVFPNAVYGNCWQQLMDLRCCPSECFSLTNNYYRCALVHMKSQSIVYFQNYCLKQRGSHWIWTSTWPFARPEECFPSNGKRCQADLKLSLYLLVSSVYWLHIWASYYLYNSQLKTIYDWISCP